MTTISAPPDLQADAFAHLSDRPEQVGFFLAEYLPGERRFDLREWRPLRSDQLEYRSDYHVEVGDEARIEAIKWAWDSGLSLVEAHSHGDDGVAAFSGSDIHGFRDWVPHLWWRLRGRPYAALVVAGSDFDAIAWIDGADSPEQVDRLAITEGATVAATRQSLRWMTRRVPQIRNV